MSHFIPTRRTALRAFAGIGAALGLGAAACGPEDSALGGTAAAPSRTPAADGERRFGAEWESHVRTFMSW